MGPIFVAAVKDSTGSFAGALPVIGFVLLVAMVFPLVTRRPGERKERGFWGSLFPRRRARGAVTSFRARGSDDTDEAVDEDRRPSRAPQR